MSVNVKETNRHNKAVNDIYQYFVEGEYTGKEVNFILDCLKDVVRSELNKNVLAKREKSINIF